LEKTVRVKICGVRTRGDLKAAIDAGADAIGLLVGQIYASPDFILPGTAGRIAESLPPFVSPVIVTHLTEPSPILEILRKTHISNVQLHGGSSVDDVAKIRGEIHPSGKIILAVHVIKGEAIPDFEPYIPYINAIVLDSFNKSSGQAGGTGKIHDWKKSAEIVRRTKIPVILAGGLNPQNVAEAIRTVHPFGVDANSGLKDKNRACSKELCSAFVREAKKETK
jgi:phosphoribosylanthranilate isomerase